MLLCWMACNWDPAPTWVGLPPGLSPAAGHRDSCQSKSVILRLLSVLCDRGAGLGWMHALAKTKSTKMEQKSKTKQQWWLKLKENISFIKIPNKKTSTDKDKWLKQWQLQRKPQCAWYCVTFQINLGEISNFSLLICRMDMQQLHRNISYSHHSQVHKICVNMIQINGKWRVRCFPLIGSPHW